MTAATSWIDGTDPWLVADRWSQDLPVDLALVIREGVRIVYEQAGQEAPTSGEIQVLGERWLHEVAARRIAGQVPVRRCRCHRDPVRHVIHCLGPHDVPSPGEMVAAGCPYAEAEQRVRSWR